MRVIVSGVTVLPEDAPEVLVRHLKKKFTLVNRDYQILQQLGKARFVSPVVRCYFMDGRKLVLPRFADRMLRNIQGVEFVDDLADGEDVSYQEQTKKLRNYQEEAVFSALANGNGLVVMPPGMGKTVVGVEIIRRFGRNALWLAHTTELVDQAKSALSEITNSVGVYSGLRKETRGDVVVATVQSLYQGVPEELANRGVLILDEAHHAPAPTFFSVLASCRARHRFGLTATPKRRDGLTKMMFWSLGDVIYWMEATNPEVTKRTVQPTVIPIRIEHEVPLGMIQDYTNLCTQLAEMDVRNKLIIRLIAEDPDHYYLVLCSRKKQCHMLVEMMKREYPDINALAFTSEVPPKQRAEMMERWRKREVQVVFATNIAEEGLDVRHLDRLVLTFPMSGGRRLSQSVGRIMRPAKGKKDAIVYDLVDSGTEGFFRKRLRTYERLGCKVETSRRENLWES